MINRIRIPSQWLDDTGRQHTRVADFQLGLGSCGKVVKTLACELTTYDGAFVVTQRTDDHEVKTFIYPMATITGRIEITEK